MRKVEIELEHYKMLVEELEILHTVGQVIIEYEKESIKPEITLDLITKLVFKEYSYSQTSDNEVN